MRLLHIMFLIVTFYFTSCTSLNKMCNSHLKNLSRQIDTTKEYNLKGSYCIGSIKDTSLFDGDNCIVKFNIFDRLSGKQVKNGVIYFYGQDTTSIIFNNWTYEKKIKTGYYIIEAWASKYEGTKTKKLTINKNKKIEINFYLGTKLEF